MTEEQPERGSRWYSLPLRGALKWLTKKLFYRKVVWKMQGELAQQIRDEHGEEFLEYEDVDVTVGTNPHVDEASRRVFITFGDLFRISDETEANLAQEIMRKRFFPDMVELNPDFSDTLVAYETTKYLEQRPKRGDAKARKHYHSVLRRGRTNKYLETIDDMHESGQLKKLLSRLKKKIQKAPRKTKRYSLGLRTECTKEIDSVDAEIRDEFRDEDSVDEISTEDLIKENRPAKKWEDAKRMYGAERIVKAISRDKPLKWGKGILSYYLIAKKVYDRPGQTMKDLTIDWHKSINSVKYAVICLLSEGTGLELVERRKGGKKYKLYPSERFISLAKKYGYKKQQRDLNDYK